MLRPNTTAYMRSPKNSGRRELHACRVLTVQGEVCTASLVHHTLEVAPNLDLLIYYSVDRKFYQQAIRVDALLESWPHKVLAFKTVGEPVSAEARQCYRVSAAVSGVTVTMGSEPGAPLGDVSAAGFSATCAGKFQIGQNVAVSLVYEGRKYTGLATVQSVNDAGGGRSRYGMHCAEARHTSGDLAKGLAQLSAALQRAQLRRLAGG